ncbi:Ribosomal large subunit pseudouridine synthase C [Roseimaritima multifibrata]|uniref:Ribosomal large subunit pseudouridine synthase C n=2 Tax=Roseimaritima multifibrata TaxID=1930274 RepID=A0A517MNI5_9BACT|nr:Ribosomal large subunit pseudouridine synthase C [Roseimaritima multifibrata]
MTDSPLPILHEDPHFLVINKPAGLFSQAAKGILAVEPLLKQQLRNRDSLAKDPFLGLPHRLDQWTSGLLLVAKSKLALRQFGGQFQSRKVTKTYLALLSGTLAEGTHVWEDRLRKVEGQPRSEVVPFDSDEGQLAKLEIRRLAVENGLTLARIELFTGRMHQIRVQASRRGLPVAGDVTYCKNVPAEVSESDRGSRQGHALHAWELGFRHPKTAVPLQFSAEPPVDWNKKFGPLMQAWEKAT